MRSLLQVKPTLLKPVTGRVLVSVPYYNDPFFNHSVVLIIERDEENCVGLIINQELNCTVRQAVSGVKIDMPVFAGGPVMHQAAFALHNFENCKESEEILPNVYTGYDEILLAIFEYNAIPKMDFKFFIGYSGWSPGQLEDEIKRKMWVVAEGSEELVLKTPTPKIWEKAVKSLGKEYAHWLEVPKNILDN
ncbi:MAG: YqgE/AlgH family protein [Bacteroidetes bacterium]|nr:YqgE/AlgH family protein [Bacteroidota bacterium]MCL1969168.1 YqgE/AlgH family protein [Bacteroidota bacterium]